jgi:hypothetical protein
VRGTKNPDLGAVTGLRPDLVLANKENRRLDVERLRAAGVPVWVADIRTLDEAIVSLRRMFSAALGWPEPPWLAQAERAWRQPVPGSSRQRPIRLPLPLHTTVGERGADHLEIRQTCRSEVSERATPILVCHLTP